MLNGFFSMDGPFYKIGTLVFDLIILNILCIFFGGPLAILILISTGILAKIPIAISIAICIFLLLNGGAAITATIYVSNRKVRGADKYLWQDFWSSFKSNYKQATIIWIIFIVVNGLVTFNIFNAKNLGSLKNIILPVQFFLAIEGLFIGIYIFSLLARFHMSIKQLFKSAFIMANKHIFTTIICVGMLGVIGYLISTNLLFMGIAFSGYAYLLAYFTEKVFEKYMPEEELNKNKYDDREYMSKVYDYKSEENNLYKQFRDQEDKTQE